MHLLLVDIATHVSPMSRTSTEISSSSGHQISFRVIGIVVAIKLYCYRVYILVYYLKKKKNEKEKNEVGN